MPRLSHDGIETEYETFGDAADPALLLVNGLGGQLVAWDPGLIDAFVDRGFFVVIFDNRDVGLSTHATGTIDVVATMTAILSKQPYEPPPYLLTDLAADAVALLDHLGIDRAHVFGVSMGGMIAQTIAIEHRRRVASLTSVMSTTGDPDVGQADESVLPFLLQRGPTEREAAVEHQVTLFKALCGVEHFEEERTRRRAELSYDRAFDPRGVGRQLVAILASGSRTERLRSLRVPTLVIHGDKDPLVDVSGGLRTVEVVPGAELLILEGMGHDLPTYFWPPIVEAVTRLAARSAATA